MHTHGCIHACTKRVFVISGTIGKVAIGKECLLFQVPQEIAGVGVSAGDSAAPGTKYCTKLHKKVFLFPAQLRPEIGGVGG